MGFGKIRLTDYASCAGCAAKIGQDSLMEVLAGLPVMKDKDLLVGIETADDAGVYRISENLAVILTLDFFPPIVDDPYMFGQIAAANALSDVYAMGGAPRLAMNIVCFPKDLSLGILNEIMKGSMDKLKEAGTLLVGGHSVEDKEIKYGMSVTGFIDPKDIKTNSGAKPGDVLILTKPIGVGIITSALKAKRIKPEDAGEAFASMMTLNKAASEAMVEVGVNACTDITGYGVLGHSMEMAKGSDVSIVLESSKIKLLPLALDLIKKKSNRPRTLMSNREFIRGELKVSGISEDLELLLFDPQTSGGLLISVPEEKSGILMDKLKARGVDPAVIGSVWGRKEGHRIEVV